MVRSLHIGTSGWSYKDWKGLYYPENLKYTETENRYKFVHLFAWACNFAVRHAFYRPAKALSCTTFGHIPCILAP